MHAHICTPACSVLTFVLFIKVASAVLCLAIYNALWCWFLLGVVACDVIVCNVEL